MWIRYLSDTFASDIYQIDIDPRAIAIWVRDMRRIWKASGHNYDKTLECIGT